MAEGEFLEVRAPLQGINLRLVSFSGHEEVSRLFSFTLELQADTLKIEPAQIIGEPLGFSVYAGPKSYRHFHGVVSRFACGRIDGNRRFYQAEVVPALWLLTRTSDCRIFSDKSVPDVVEQVLGEHDVKFEKKLSQTHDKWTYNVQYRETDFNFVSRILEQEGIFYYFKHDEAGHTLVLGDKPTSFGAAPPECKEVRYEYSYPPKEHSITSWTRQFQFIPGKYTQTDYEFKDFPSKAEQTPAHLLKTEASALFGAHKPPPKISPTRHEIFDYPAEYDNKGDAQYTTNRMEEEQAAFDVASGVSIRRFFGAGVRFKMKEHASDDGEYVLLAVQHSATNFSESQGGSANYSNSFSCIPKDVQFRPARRTPKPAIQGVQTAVVVGPPGVEINTDEFGRVQVQFFWDRYSKRRQDPSHEPTPIWIRVGQIIAGKSWGAMFIPRVGQEVMVAFEEGDPDRPLVTGVLYNGDQKPPYDPKQEPTRSYIKTNSSPGGEGYNELRFDDKKDKQQIFIHAERNMDVRVKNDSLERIYGNRHQIIGWEKDGKKGGDQREKVWQDKHQLVKRNQHEHIEGNYSLTVGSGEAEDPGKLHLTVEKQVCVLVGKSGSGFSLEVDDQGNLKQELAGVSSTEIKQDQHQKIGMNYAIEAGMEIHLKSGTNMVLESSAGLTLKVGGNFVSLTPAGVFIQGTMVMINSGGAAGSGSGAKPEKPGDCEPAAPTAPAMADDHKSGQKSTPY